MASANSCWLLPAPAVFYLLLLFSAGSSFLAVTFPGLWWAEFHAEKEMGAKLMGLPGSTVAVAIMLGEDALPASLSKKICMSKCSMVNY